MIEQKRGVLEREQGYWRRINAKIIHYRVENNVDYRTIKGYHKGLLIQGKEILEGPLGWRLDVVAE